MVVSTIFLHIGNQPPLEFKASSSREECESRIAAPLYNQHAPNGQTISVCVSTTQPKCTLHTWCGYLIDCVFFAQGIALFSRNAGGNRKYSHSQPWHSHCQSNPIIQNQRMWPRIRGKRWRRNTRFGEPRVPDLGCYAVAVRWFLHFTTSSYMFYLRRSILLRQDGLAGGQAGTLGCAPTNADPSSHTSPNRLFIL